MSAVESPLGFPIEWDVCPGCGKHFAAQYREFEAYECADCEEQAQQPTAPAGRNYFAGVDGAPAPATPGSSTPPQTALYSESLSAAVARIAGKDRS